jgi:hypothetical protein
LGSCGRGGVEREGSSWMVNLTEEGGTLWY